MPLSARCHARIAACAIACASVLSPAPVRAGGIEYSGSGTVGLGRGGATTARADDPLVLMNNPAGLAELQGDQLLLSLTYVDARTCFEPAGTYGWGAYLGGSPFELTDPDTGEVQRFNIGQLELIGPREQAYYLDPLDTVCGNAARTPLPQVAWGSRINDRLGVGFGFVFPSAMPSAQWAEGPDGVIHGDDGELRAAPSRYMQVGAGNLALFPSVGVGYRITDMLRVGLMLQWGVVSVDISTMIAQGGGTSPHHDMLARVRAEDYFVPAATASIHLVPHDAWDIVLAYKYQAGVDASGHIELTTGLYLPKNDAPDSVVRHTQDNLKLQSVRQEMPDKLSLGVRFADRLVGRTRDDGNAPYDPTRGVVIRDPLQDERWDLELDVDYTFTSEVQEMVAVPAPGQYPVIAARNGDTRELVDTPVPVTRIPRQWSDQVAIKLGGTYNPLPGRLGISGGVHYETRGVDPRYMSVDFWPLQRLGLHTGLIVRVAEQIDVSLSYAHIFQETLVVRPPPHGDRVDGGFDKRVGTQVELTDELPVIEEEPQGASDGEAALAQNLARTAQGAPAWISNAGTYRSGYDIVSLGLNVHW